MSPNVQTVYPDTTTPCSKSWSVHDSKAAGIIVAHVLDCLALEVGKMQHAKDMFNKLVKIHQDTNISVSMFYTFIHMLALRWDGSSSTLSNYISAISAADAKLTTMKKQID